MYELPLQDAPRRAPVSAVCNLMLRLLPWSPMRRAVGGALAGCIRALRPESDEVALAPELAAAAEKLRADGLTSIAPVFSPAELEEVLAYLGPQRLLDKHGRQFRAAQAPTDAGQASYPLPTVARCPQVTDLMNRPDLLQLARSYLGCTPTISGLRVDWSAPTACAPGHVQQFHRDYDDWRFMKLFVYLTDVDEGCGPHEYVVGSHRGSGRFRAVAQSDEEVERRWGRERRRRVLGPRGTSFFADTWGLHKGNVPTTRPRLLLQIQYSVLPVFKFAYRPVAVPRAEHYNRYVNRLILEGRSGRSFS